MYYRFKLDIETFQSASDIHTIVMSMECALISIAYPATLINRRRTCILVDR
jgi:hypothetical protein